MFQSPTKKPGIFHVGKGDRAVPFETKVDEVEVLCNDGCGGTGKIKGEGIFNGTKIMQLEDKVLGKVGFVSPDHPPNTNITESKLVSAEIELSRKPGFGEQNTHEVLIETTLGSLKSHSNLG